MKILFISFFDPRQLDGGAEQRTHRLWKALSRLGEVFTCVIVYRKEEECYDASARILKVCLERRYSFRWFSQHVCTRLFPQVTFPFHAKEAGGRIFPDVKFDVVVARYLKSAAYVKAWDFGPLFIDVDDDPVEVVETQRLFPGCFNTLYARFVRGWRDCILARARGGWCARKSSSLNLDVLENAAFGPSSDYEAESKRENLLLIVGKLDYVPNQKGIERFLKTVWPFLLAADADLKLAIIGKGDPSRDAGWWASMPHVTLVGYVEDLLPWYECALATIAPAVVGGGTSIKVIESLQYGRPCLASAFARRGCTDRGFYEGIIPLEDVTVETAGEILRNLRAVEPVSLINSATRAFGVPAFNDVVAQTILKACGPGVDVRVEELK